jgi:hypothetical protein
MTFLAFEPATALGVEVTDDSISVQLHDGRTVTAPLSWYPRLNHATPDERRDWALIGAGSGIHWPQLDEDISIESLLAGRRSAERPESLKPWLERRRMGTR